MARKRNISRKSKTGPATLPERKRKLKSIMDRVETLRKQARALDAKLLLDKHYDEFGSVPDYLDIRALTLLGIGEPDEADRILRQALKAGKTARRLSLLGFAWHQRGDEAEALKWHVAALEVDPKDFHTYANLANTLKNMGRYDEAMEMLHTAYRLSNGDAQVIENMSATLLTMGNIADGAKMFEAAFATGDRVAPIDFRVKYWKGEDISDKTILIWREFGLGDEIRNANMIPDLMADAGHVVFECSARLIPLFERSFPGLECIAQDPDDFRTTLRPPFDYHAGIESLLMHYRASVADFPTTAGYLKPDPERVAFWRRRFETLDAEHFVGISWSSSLINRVRRQDYVTLDRFAEIGAKPGVALINCFYAADSAEMAAFEAETGIEIHRWDDIDLRNDIDDSAAMTKALDLLIAVTNANHDIAGAVGIEHWVLSSPHWSIMHGTDHIPYYPRARVYLRRADLSFDYLFTKLNRDFDDWLAARAKSNKLRTTA